MPLQAAAHGLSLKRDLLKRIPRWEEMTDLRYALGSRNDIAECFSCYLTVLEVVLAAVKSMEGLRLGPAEFLIGQPPWMQDDPSKAPREQHNS